MVSQTILIAGHNKIFLKSRDTLQQLANLSFKGTESQKVGELSPWGGRVGPRYEQPKAFLDFSGVPFNFYDF